MGLDQLYLEALAVPAAVFKTVQHRPKIIFKQGKILTSAYIALFYEIPDHATAITVFRHSQNLFSLCLTHADLTYILGPILVTDVTAHDPTSTEARTIYLPQVLSTYSITRDQCLKQILALSQILHLSVTAEAVTSAFEQALRSDQFNDKLILVNFDDEGAHVSYAYEKALKTAVELGKPSMVHDAFVGLVNSGRIGILADGSNLRNIKNWGIISTSVTLRAAIHAGMDFDQAYSLNDHYVRTLETLTTYDDVMTGIETMIKDMAQRVHQLKSAHLSAPVRRAYQVIMNSPESTITVTQLANQLGLSPHYLSTLFTAEIGIPISRFRILVKINRAIEILHTTNLPLSEIAAILNFTDQAYLTREFKRFVGVSPYKARKNPHLTDDWHLYNFTSINIG
ncbi:helix-turn-helix domain-containing protein [Levilactobacillus parabrevis]|uniref:helix-turn-helix domain-containing protein n=1 Tax=Levilactobacillus parabrevis TaxID=357278 RepID=UPI0021A38DF0|nr:AraC family transcriptional regulator [Levilactobacillus parabrevis]MCT4487975.1 helix-turn-helix domain-containing protein [Levilactobacillus parabrevis]MCT4490417.1 helix-turn-helix domain-containing protein [Levilactobacillus parabrevis]